MVVWAAVLFSCKLGRGFKLDKYCDWVAVERKFVVLDEIGLHFSREVTTISKYVKTTAAKIKPKYFRRELFSTIFENIERENR